MLEAKEYSAKLVFEGAEEFTSVHLSSLLKDATRAQGLDAEIANDTTALAEAQGAGFSVKLSDMSEAGETILDLKLETTAPAQEDDAMKATLAGYLRDILVSLPATQVEWLDTGARISRDQILDALTPAEEASAQQSEYASLAPRRVINLEERRQARTARPTAGQHAKIKAFANAAKIQQRQALLATGTDCAITLDNSQIETLLPPVDRSQRMVAANDNALRGFSVADAKISRLEGTVRSTILAAETEEAEPAPLPVEARLTTWAVSLTVATFSLPVAAPVMIYNIARGEDMRVASLAMGLAGFFTVLSGSGAMAGVLGF